MSQRKINGSRIGIQNALNTIDDQYSVQSSLQERNGIIRQHKFGRPLGNRSGQVAVSDHISRSGVSNGSKTGNYRTITHPQQKNAMQGVRNIEEAVRAKHGSQYGTLDQSSQGSRAPMKSFAQQQLQIIDGYDTQQKYDSRHMAMEVDSSILVAERPRSELRFNNQNKPQVTRMKLKRPTSSQMKQQGELCHEFGCKRPELREQVCQHHFVHKVRHNVRLVLKQIYRGPEMAFAAMDFSGRGYVTEEDLMSNNLLSRFKYPRKDIQTYVRHCNIFNNHGSSPSGSPAKGGAKIPTNGVAFDKFKKSFFPHLYVVAEDVASEDEQANQMAIQNMRKNRKEQPEIIEKRLLELERMMKLKFSNCYESVRKAFLALDTDYDGYLDVENFLAYFSNEKNINYDDLKKLITDKDSKKKGKINYSDFSRWMGNSIHMCEGFYFRHDSSVNPQYEKNMKTMLKKNAQAQADAGKCLVTSENLETKVLEKIQFQWKTIRKAFQDLNLGKTGIISQDELRYYLAHWGLVVEEVDFIKLFNKFDEDKDGQISYRDFQQTVGHELFPAEGLYFRQDKTANLRIIACKHDRCWAATPMYANFCPLHSKMHQDQCILLFGEVFQKIGKSWRTFINDLKSQAEKEDKAQVFADDFFITCANYKVHLSDAHKQNLLLSFPGRDEGARKRLNIQRIYDQKYNTQFAKLYKKIDAYEGNGEDDAVDVAGYTGNFQRSKDKTVPMSDADFLLVMMDKEKVQKLVNMVKGIDKDHTGFVTRTELDDILKILCPELMRRDLTLIYRPFASNSNRILIEYKKFFQYLLSSLSQLDDDFTTMLQSAKICGKSPNKVQVPLNRSKSTAMNEQNTREYYNSSKQQQSLDVMTAAKELLAQRKTSIQPRNSGNRSALTHDPINLKAALRDCFTTRRETEKPADIKERTHNLNKFASMVAISPTNARFEDESETRTLTHQRSVDPYSNKFQTMQQDGQSTRERVKSAHLNGAKKRFNSTLNVNYLNTVSGDVNKQRQSQAAGNGAAQGFEQQGGNILEDNEIQFMGDYKKGDRLTEHFANRRFSEQNEFRPTLGSNQYLDEDNLNQVSGNKRHQTPTSRHNFRAMANNTGTLSDNASQNSGNNNISYTRSNRSKGIILARVGYEWKAIYKRLTRIDRNNSGLVTMKQMDEAMTGAGVNLTKDDVNKVISLFAHEKFELGSDTRNVLINYLKMSVEMGLQQPSMTQYHRSNNRVLDIEKLKDALMTNTLVTPQNQPRKQMFFEGTDLERVEEKRKRGGSYANLSKNRTGTQKLSKTRRQISRKGATVAEGIADVLRNADPRDNRDAESQAAFQNVGTSTKEKIQQVMRRQQPLFQHLTAAQLATEAQNKDAGEPADKQIHMTLKGFRDVLRAMGLNLSYQDMIRFSVASMTPSGNKRAPVRGTPNVARNNRAGIIIDVSAFQKAYATSS